MTFKTTISVFCLFLLTSFSGQQEEELYNNYLAALENQSTFQYFLVVQVKDLNNGHVREYCTKGNFLKGALHREFNLNYDSQGISKVNQIAIENKERYFEFKNDSAIWNIGGVWEYSIKELTDFEKQQDFDALATQIRNKGKWSKEIADDKTMLMYAHALFNRGILTGENNCWGGTLHYVDRNKKE